MSSLGATVLKHIDSHCPTTISISWSGKARNELETLQKHANSQKICEDNYQIHGKGFGRNL